MALSTILSLSIALLCLGIFTVQRRWLMVAAWLCSATSTVLGKVIKSHPAAAVADLFAALFAVFVLCEIIRLLVAKYAVRTADQAAAGVAAAGPAAGASLATSGAASAASTASAADT